MIVLVGASAAGKSTWAAERYRDVEIVASDDLRGIVGSGSADQGASGDAFALLNQILAARTKRRLTTVVDATSLQRKLRMGYLAQARSTQLPAVLVILDTDPSMCRARNAARDRRVPAAVLDQQLRQVAHVVEQAPSEGWDAILHVRQGGPSPTSDPVPPTGRRKLASSKRGCA